MSYRPLTEEQKEWLKEAGLPEFDVAGREAADRRHMILMGAGLAIYTLVMLAAIIATAIGVMGS